MPPFPWATLSWLPGTTASVTEFHPLTVTSGSLPSVSPQIKWEDFEAPLESCPALMHGRPDTWDLGWFGFNWLKQERRKRLAHPDAPWLKWRLLCISGFPHHKRQILGECSWNEVDIWLRTLGLLPQMFWNGSNSEWKRINESKPVQNSTPLGWWEGRYSFT